MAGDPTTPTRAELSRALNGDSRLIQAFEDLFFLIPDDLNRINQVNNAINSLIAPSISRLNAFASKVFPTQIQWDASKGSSVELTDNTQIIVDMSLGDVDVVLPASMQIGASISRIGGNTNTLSITGTINGASDWEICFDGSTASIFYDKSSEEYRFGGYR